jgi:hypothetical protein
MSTNNEAGCNLVMCRSRIVQESRLAGQRPSDSGNYTGTVGNVFTDGVVLTFESNCYKYGSIDVQGTVTTEYSNDKTINKHSLQQNNDITQNPPVQFSFLRLDRRVFIRWNISNVIR